MTTMKKSLKNKKHDGFTIVETMAVIVIIAILAAVAIVGISSYMDRANYSKVNADLGSYDYAIQTMMLEYPAVVSGAQAYGTETVGEDSIQALLEDILPAELALATDGATTIMQDPWGGVYNVEITDTDSTDYTNECYIYIYTYGGDANADGGDDAFLVVQYGDGEVFSTIFTNVDYDNTEVAFDYSTTT